MYRKRELVERSELILPWRPFYRLVSDSVYSRHERHGLELLPPYAVEFFPYIFYCYNTRVPTPPGKTWIH